MIYKVFICALFINTLCSCQISNQAKHSSQGVFVKVLGITQDAGYPQVNCKKSCCIDKWHDQGLAKKVASIGIGDPKSNKYFMIDATPDFPYQLASMQKDLQTDNLPDAVFLTHAHIGHYTGLMHLGREAVGAKNQLVYAMPRMVGFLTENGPWGQLVSLNNILIDTLQNGEKVLLSESVTIEAFEVPHRDEYSETVGFVISGPNKRLLYIPDIDKWSKWNQDIKTWISSVDYALLDGTFYRNGEIFGRDMSQIPHPFIEESRQLFSDLPIEDQSKVYFIHLNHTNPLLDEHSSAYKSFKETPFHIASEGMVFLL